MSNSDEWEVAVARAAAAIRRRVLRHTLENNGGYLSQACSSAESLAMLYLRLMRLGPSVAPPIPLPFPGAPGPGRPAFTGSGYNGRHQPELDRLYFSPVHYALVLYATLIETGRMAPEALAHFNRDGSTVELIGAEHSPGHEVTAGSLGQCLSQAAGAAMARKRKGETGRNWVFMSDGEFQEGQSWETLAAACWHRLDNLIFIVDANGQQCDGPMEGVMGGEPLTPRIAAFGPVTVEVDGHSLPELDRAARTDHPDRPLAIIARTDPCRGIELLAGRGPKLHYVRFKGPEERAAYAELLERWERSAGEEV